MKKLKELLAPPLLNFLMIPREQHVRHFDAAVLLRPRVVGIFLLAAERSAETLFRRGFVLPQHAGNVTRHGINEHHGGELATREHIIADADFLIDPTPVDNPLINPLVVSAEKN